MLSEYQRQDRRMHYGTLIPRRRHRTFQLWAIIPKAGIGNMYRRITKNELGGRIMMTQMDNWHVRSDAERGDFNSHHPPTKPSTRGNPHLLFDKTHHLQTEDLLHSLTSGVLSYLINTPDSTLHCAQAQAKFSVKFCPHICLFSAEGEAIMADASSRSRSASRDLQRAKEAFEKSTSQEGKRKIIGLEIYAREEENMLSDEQLSKEVDWIIDPGTPSTRETQFSRTQVECWRMKTMLAKAMEVQGEQADQLRTLQKFAETMTNDHMAVVESSEFKLSGILHDVDTINKKLSVLIKLLQQGIARDTMTTNLQRGEHSGVNLEPPKLL